MKIQAAEVGSPSSHQLAHRTQRSGLPTKTPGRTLTQWPLLELLKQLEALQGKVHGSADSRAALGAKGVLTKHCVGEAELLLKEMGWETQQGEVRTSPATDSAVKTSQATGGRR